MERSESIKGLSAALVAAQATMSHAAKDSSNPHFKSKFASLVSVTNSVLPKLNEFGLSVVQLPSYADGIAYVETILMHESGEYVSGTAGAPVVKRDPQGIGSATTYLRRYGLAALAGIAQEDDDANLASQRKVADPAVKGLTAKLEKLIQDRGTDIPAEGLDAAMEAVGQAQPERLRAAITYIEGLK